MASDSVRITNMPDSGSHERVGYDLWINHRMYLKDDGTPAEKLQRSLRLFSECRRAAHGGVPDLDGLA